MAARTACSPALASLPKQRIIRLGSLLLACLLTLSLLHLLSPHPLAEATAALDRVPWSGTSAPLAIAPLLVCPPGRYGTNPSNASAQLRAHWRRLLALGYRPHDRHRRAAHRSLARGFVTFESGMWPRPAHCFSQRGPPRLVHDVPPGTCEPNGRACDKYRISRRFRFVWHHVWKGGTTSLSPYLSCNMDALPVAGLLRALPAPLPGYLQVGTAREPLQRFLSGFQEVYSRVRLKPRGARCVHRNVPWLRVAMRASGNSSGGSGSGGSGNDSGAGACASPDEALPTAQLRRIFTQFVRDVECARHFPNGQHLYSQSLFLGGNTSVPQPIDMLLRLESISEDLATLKAAVGYGAATADLCPLREERVAAQKPRGVPSAAALRALLEQDPALMQTVCNIYMQDFVCLGYPLPAACKLEPHAGADDTDQREGGAGRGVTIRAADGPRGAGGANLDVLPAASAASKTPEHVPGWRSSHRRDRKQDEGSTR